MPLLFSNGHSTTCVTTGAVALGAVRTVSGQVGAAKTPVLNQHLIAKENRSNVTASP
jgi:hypothetical protein